MGRRSSLLAAFALVLSLAPGATGPAATAAEPKADRTRFPPTPASFDAASIRLTDAWFRDGTNLSLPYTMGLDGSDVRELAPIRDVIGQVRPGVWLEWTDARGCPRGMSLARPGTGAFATWCDIAADAAIVGGAVYAARTGRSRAATGRGVWRFPADGGRPRRVWDLGNAELYHTIVVSEDGRWIAAGPYLGQFRTQEPPGARVRRPDGRVDVLPKWLTPVGWDARGRLILRGNDIRAWDPRTGAISVIGRRSDDRWALVLPGGRHIVITGHGNAWRWSYGVIDVRTGKRTDVTLPSMFDPSEELSTARYLVFEHWSWDPEDVDAPSIRYAVMDLREGWLGYLDGLPDPPRPGYGSDAAGMPRPPARFDASAVTVLGGSDGDPGGVAGGLIHAAVDGSGGVPLAPAAAQAGALAGGWMVWSSPDADGGWTLQARSPGGGETVRIDGLARRDLRVSRDSTVVWAWLPEGIAGERLWWIDVTSGERRRTPVTSEASDVHVAPDGTEVAWTVLEDRVERGVVWAHDTGMGLVDAPVAGYAPARVRLFPLGTQLASVPDPDVRRFIGPPDVAIRSLGVGWVVVGPLPAANGWLQRLRVTGPRSDPLSDFDVVLPRGSWRMTSFGDRRFVVLWDALSRRYGVYDAREDWFGVVPAWPAEVAAGR